MKHQTLYGCLLAAGIIAVVICVGMATGFSGMNPFVTNGPVSNTNTAVQPVITGTIATDTAQYIKVDPVADKITGDLLIVTGSTNLPAGTVLMVMTSTSGGDVMVRKGTGGVNRISVPIDTSSMKPGAQTITITTMKGDPAKGDYRFGDVNGTATFTLKGTYRGTDTPVQPTITKDDYIRLNAIGDRSAGDQFLITGTTSLPAGTGIFWQIIPKTETPLTAINMTSTGIMANNAVTKGEGNINRVSLAVDTNDMAPGEYTAVVAVMKGDLATGDITMGDLAGSALFTIR